jgi:hypothetical protein
MRIVICSLLVRVDENLGVSFGSTGAAGLGFFDPDGALPGNAVVTVTPFYGTSQTNLLPLPPSVSCQDNLFFRQIKP